MEDTEQRQAPKPFLWPFGTELNFTNSSFRDLSAFEHDYSFTYGCDYKYIISLRFCFIKILNYRDFIAAFFTHTYHTNQQIMFTTRKNNHLHSKGRKHFNCCCPQKSFLLRSESLAGSLSLSGIGKFSHWNQCSPFFIEITAFPNCHKMTLF